MSGAVVSLKTTVRNAAAVVSIVVTVGATLMWRTADRAILLADKVVAIGTELELSKQDRRVIHEEIRVLGERITRLERMKLCQE